jgi:hypothetical protein
VKRWRLFLIWAGVLAALWVFANWPRDGGTLKPDLEWAGFPWTFVFWDSGEVRWFDRAALAADIALGLAVVAGVAWLCARSRAPRSPPKPVLQPSRPV